MNQPEKIQLNMGAMRSRALEQREAAQEKLILIQALEQKEKELVDVRAELSALRQSVADAGGPG